MMAGRPRQYDRAYVMDIVCALLIEGKCLEEICASNIEGVPKRAGTIHEWLLEDEQLAALHARARNIQALTLRERLPLMFREAVARYLADGWEPKDAIQAAKVECDAEKWRLARMFPKECGDRITQEHTGNGGGALVVEVVTFSPPQIEKK